MNPGRLIKCALLSVVLGSSPVVGQTEGLGLERIFDVGVLQGPEEQMFGLIVDAVADSRGNVYVLDRHSPHLKVYAPEGAFVTSVGQSGEGPGEYAYASAIERDRSDRIHVLDRANARIYVYQLEDGALSAVRTIRVPPWILDFCVLDDTYFVLGAPRGAEENGVIHQLDEDGSVLRSFGVPFLVDPPVYSGELVCLSEPASILVAASEVATVRRYAPSGELVWSTTLDGFNQMTIEALPGGGGRFSAPENGGVEDLTVSASRLGSEVIVQFGPPREGMGDLEALDEVTSVFLRLESGDESRRLASVGKIEFADETRLIEITAQPFPRMTVYRHRDPE